jgi:hypothetical protein
LDDFSIESQALAYFQTEMARDQGLGLVAKQIVQPGTNLPRNLQNISKSSRRQQRGLGTSAFNDRIGGNGRPVHNKSDGLCRYTRIVQRSANHLHQGYGRIAGCAGHLD